MTAITAQQERVAELVQPIFESQRAFFESGATRPYDFRVKQLKKLKAAIKKYEAEIYDALAKDLRKSEFETYVSEIGFMYQDINHTIKHLKSWMRDEKVSTSIVHFPSNSKVVKDPLGTVLIIAPWNYPFQLTLAPLVAAIAAGNTAILKPSEFTENTALIIEKIIKESFDSDFVHVVQGEGFVVVPQLMDNFRFDHIFYTGGPRVGKIIAQEAAKELIPMTLELGGKSPCIVDKSVNVDIVARRMIFGKFFNAGQTCVAPDYVLVHESMKDSLITACIKTIEKFYTENPKESPDLARIVSKRQFERLERYLKDGEIVYGGEKDKSELYVAPTLIDDVSMEDDIMQEEIFGPILPFLTFSDIDEAIEMVRVNPTPLALYLFTINKKVEEKVLGNLRFGGGCINNAIVHLSNPNLPFGGVGSSGIGSYHGRNGFDTFSHNKAIMKTKFFYDNDLRYPPYTNAKINLAKKFFE